MLELERGLLTFWRAGCSCIRSVLGGTCWLECFAVEVVVVVEGRSEGGGESGREDGRLCVPETVVYDVSASLLAAA